MKVKVRVGCVPQASDGMRSCAAVYVLHSVRGINPSTPTPARVSVERVYSRVCGRARSSTPTLAGRCSLSYYELARWFMTKATLLSFHFMNRCSKTKFQSKFSKSLKKLCFYFLFYLGYSFASWFIPKLNFIVAAWQITGKVDFVKGAVQTFQYGVKNMEESKWT